MYHTRLKRSIIVLLAWMAAVPAAEAPQAIPPGAERAYSAVKERVDADAAMGVVRFMDQYWRLAGNPGFDASVDTVRDRLAAGGLAPRVEEFPARGRGWD